MQHEIKARGGSHDYFSISASDEKWWRRLSKLTHVLALYVLRRYLTSIEHEMPLITLKVDEILEAVGTAQYLKTRLFNVSCPT